VILNGKIGYEIKNGIVNKFLQPVDSKIPLLNHSTNTIATNRNADAIEYIDGKPDYLTTGTLGSLNVNDNAIYQALQKEFGEFIEIKSETYKNSEFTIFIHMPQKDSDGDVKIYGQWNGINLK
jgi:hypothetical protein